MLTPWRKLRGLTLPAALSSGGYVQLQGKASLGLDMVVNEGKVSALENCNQATLGNVTMNGGEIFIQGDIKTGDLTLNGGALTFDFSWGRTPLLDLDGNDLFVGDNVSITMNVKEMEDIVGEYVLFTNMGETTGLDSVDITFVDSNKNTKTITASYSNGSVVLVPEPTTATLSLLALAGLAARRRR